MRAAAAARPPTLLWRIEATRAQPGPSRLSHVQARAIAEGSRSSNPTFRDRESLAAVSRPEDRHPAADHPSHGWRAQPHHPAHAQMWDQIYHEAARDLAAEPALTNSLCVGILSHACFEDALASLLSTKLSDNWSAMGGTHLMSVFQRACDADPSIAEAAVSDLLAIRDRDPACDKYSQAMLNFKGYQAVQTSRVAHWLWNQGRQPLALALQNRASELFHVDIHPGAQIGRGFLLDHASGVVIGETAFVGDNVSLLHRVSLGGSGLGRGIRHPTIGHGVLLGAGVSIQGPVHVGAGSKVGAGSVVVDHIPPHSVAVGVPARVIKRIINDKFNDMDSCVSFLLDYEI